MDLAWSVLWLPVRSSVYAICLFLLIGCLFAFSPSLANAASSTIAVLYPQTTAPYQQLIEEIVTGIEQSDPSARIEKKQISDSLLIEDLRAWLAQIDASVIITLGRTPTEIYDRLHLTIPRVIGALDISPHVRPDTAGISLAVDPALLLARLKQVIPTIRQVWVVFNPRTDQWLIDLGHEAASRLGLTLQPLAATDFREATAYFQTLFGRASVQTEAIWLLDNNTLVDSQTILPFLIEQSWKRRWVIFSNSLQVTKRGTLFALYPNNIQLGQALGHLAQEQRQYPNKRFQIQPLRAVKSVLNLKLAAHLEMPITQALEQQFDLVLPPW